MNKTLEISAMQYDFHTLLKVSDICGLTGEIGFHDTDTGYLVSFPDDDGKADQRMAEYKKRPLPLKLYQRKGLCLYCIQYFQRP